MHTSLIGAARRAATVFVLALAMAHAHAAPATEATVRHYFKVANVASLTDNVVDTISSAQALEWQNETQPAEKARKKASYEATSKIVRKYVKWSEIEPMAIETYQKELDEADVQAMIVHAQSPVGQIVTHKLTPVTIKQLPAMLKYLDQRIDAIMAQKPGTPAPLLTPPAPPADHKEALARTFMLELPGAREEFAAMSATMETRMMQSIASLASEDTAKSIEPEMKRIATLFREQVTFEDIVAIKAGLLAREMSETDITALIEDNKKPERRVQLLKTKKAEAALQARMDSYLQESVFPVMLPELLKTIEIK